jgi:hypothetical protein
MCTFINILRLARQNHCQGPNHSFCRWVSSHMMWTTN